MRISLLAITLSVLLAASLAAEPIRVSSKSQLFVDKALIESMKGTALRLHSPMPREVVLTLDKPWEGPQSGYMTVLKLGAGYRMYYRGGGDLGREYTCMAESPDGIRWSKPDLGLVECDGSKANNIVWTAGRKSYGESHNFTPFVDTNPACRPEQRYKAVGYASVDNSKGESVRCLAAFVSPDGIHWQRMRERPIITEGAFDSQNVAFWDTNRGEYVCYFRDARNGKRSVKRTTSHDFVTWTRAEWLDFGDTPPEHLYTNAIAQYCGSPGIYIGLPMRFVPERKTIGADKKPIDGISDAVFITSRDGLHFDRTFMEAFIRPGLDSDNWGNAHGNTCPAWGIVPTGDKEISLYWAEHNGTIPLVRRGTLRPDGFVSVNAPYAGGEFTTVPLILTGKDLLLNCSTSAVGSITVELLDQRGKQLAESEEIYGDELARAVTWKNGFDLNHAGREPVKLRFVMKDADLYSFRVK